MGEDSDPREALEEDYWGVGYSLTWTEAVEEDDTSAEEDDTSATTDDEDPHHVTPVPSSPVPT